MNLIDIRRLLAGQGSCLVRMSVRTTPYIPGYGKGRVTKEQTMKAAIFMGPAWEMFTGIPSGPRVWGTRESMDSPFIMHKGETFLECYILGVESLGYTFLGKPCAIVESVKDNNLRCYNVKHIITMEIVS